MSTGFCRADSRFSRVPRKWRRRACLTEGQDSLPPAHALCASWQGPSPLPHRHAGIRTSRGPKPPASARPAPGGRFAPTGSGAGLCLSRTCRSAGGRRARAGETRCVSCSRPDGRKHLHRLNGRGHSPCHSATLPLAQPGATGPGQRPLRPRRALPARRVGRWPLCRPDPPVYRAPSRAGGETRCVSCSRPEGRRNIHRCNGRGHRPCHSAAPGSGPAGGPKPPASARPAPGGRFAPAGSGAGLSVFPDLPVCRAPSRAGGGNAGRVS
jgi:hypothetical protein